MSLPQIVYVQENAPDGDDDHYLLCEEDKEIAAQSAPKIGEAGACVGVYELKRVVKLTTTTTVSEEEISNV